MSDAPVELGSFLRGERDSSAFPHREHVRLAFEMLLRHPFAETAFHYSQGLRRMAEKSGRPEIYHETVTIAFLSLVAERMKGAGDFEEFVGRNPNLLDKHVLARWYTTDRLMSETARRTFILPEPAL